MPVTPEELAKRLIEADQQLLLLRQATQDMQAVRVHLLEKRHRESERSRSDRAPRR